MRHTPGPWSVESFKEPGNKHLLTYDVVDLDGVIVTKCGTGGALVKHDAHLIAAAPEMLALLEAIEHIVPDSPYRDRIHAVLAKARGE